MTVNHGTLEARSFFMLSQKSGATFPWCIAFFEHLREFHCVQRENQGGGASSVISLQGRENSGVMIITLEPSVAEGTPVRYVEKSQGTNLEVEQLV